MNTHVQDHTVGLMIIINLKCEWMWEGHSQFVSMSFCLSLTLWFRRLIKFNVSFMRKLTKKKFLTGYFANFF